MAKRKVMTSPGAETKKRPSCGIIHAAEYLIHQAIVQREI